MKYAFMGVSRLGSTVHGKGGRMGVDCYSPTYLNCFTKNVYNCPAFLVIDFKWFKAGQSDIL